MNSIVIDPNIRGRFEITLHSGRTIRMTHLSQWQTYSGLLEGHPGQSANAAIIRMARGAMESHFGNSFPVSLIQPDSSLFDFPINGTKGIVSCEVLPAITCGAVFESKSTCGDESAYSSTIITWFHDEWGPPVQNVCKQIAALNWNEIALDWSP